MPRVYTKTARASKYARTCQKCHEPITPGQSYYSWSFRYGGTRFQHAACGYPRRSQLTQSLMGEVYDAIETAEADVQGWDGREAGALNDALSAVADAAENVIEQYREADEAFGGYGATQSAERAEELEGWKDELESYYPSDWDGDFELPDDLDELTDEQRDEFDSWVDEQRGEAQDILSNCPY